MADSKKETEMAWLYHVRKLPMSIFNRSGNAIRRMLGVLSVDGLPAGMRPEIVFAVRKLTRVER